MATSWVTYWHQTRCDLAEREGAAGKPLNYLFGGLGNSASARRSKVKPGDLVYVTTMRHKTLFLLSCVRIERLLLLAYWLKSMDDSPEAQAMQALAASDPEEVLAAWVEKHHAQYLVWGGSSDVAEGVGTPLRFDVPVPVRSLTKIAFVSRKTGERMPIGGIEDGGLTAVASLQNMYRVLSPETAQDFARIMALRQDETDKEAIDTIVGAPTPSHSEMSEINE